VSGGKGTRLERIRAELGLGSEAWKARAKCKGSDPDLWLGPDREETREEKLAREDDAKVVCGECGVKDECLEWAIATRGKGVMGGTTDRERRGLTWTRNNGPR